MLTHLQLACWVIKAVLVAMALSGSGCSHAVATPAPEAVAKAALNHPWDGPETVAVIAAGKSSGESAATEPVKGCPCGPNCPCAKGFNKDCKCPKCEKCGRCDCQCECDKAAFKPVPDPIGEGTEGPGAFTGLVFVMDNNPCPHCVTQQSVIDAMPAWKDRIRVVHEGEQQSMGLPTPYGFPCCYVVIDGALRRMHVGQLSAYQIADLNAGEPFGTAEKRIPTVYRKRVWTMTDGGAQQFPAPVQYPAQRSFCPSCR